MGGRSDEFHSIIAQNRRELHKTAVFNITSHDLSDLVDDNLISPWYEENMPPEGYFGFCRTYHVHADYLDPGMLKSALDCRWSVPLDTPEERIPERTWLLAGDMGMGNASVMIYVKPKKDYYHAVIWTMSDSPSKAYRHFSSIADKIREIDPDYRICPGSGNVKQGELKAMVIRDMDASRKMAYLLNMTGLSIMAPDAASPDSGYLL